jgi:hypothetical protein
MLIDLTVWFELLMSVPITLTFLGHEVGAKPTLLTSILFITIASFFNSSSCSIPIFVNGSITSSLTASEICSIPSLTAIPPERTVKIGQAASAIQLLKVH